MGPNTIPDADLRKLADKVTIWVAAPMAPKDVWSLREAIAWAMAAPNADTITLHRPSRDDEPAAWLKPDQIARLWHSLSASRAA